MKLVIDNEYNFVFAGQDLKGKFLGEKVLHSGDIVCRMEYNNCVYPVKNKDIKKCGNSKR